MRRTSPRQLNTADLENSCCLRKNLLMQKWHFSGGISSTLTTIHATEIWQNSTGRRAIRTVHANTWRSWKNSFLTWTLPYMCHWPVWTSPWATIGPPVQRCKKARAYFQMTNPCGKLRPAISRKLQKLPNQRKKRKMCRAKLKRVQNSRELPNPSRFATVSETGSC